VLPPTTSTCNCSLSCPYYSLRLSPYDSRNVSSPPSLAHDVVFWEETLTAQHCLYSPSYPFPRFVHRSLFDTQALRYVCPRRSTGNTKPHPTTPHVKPPRLQRLQNPRRRNTGTPKFMLYTFYEDRVVSWPEVFDVAQRVQEPECGGRNMCT